MSQRTPIIAGNWKMYKRTAEARALAEQLKKDLGSPAATVVVCPPMTALSTVLETLKGSAIQVGAQNCHWEKEGAYTGEVSAPMLQDIGCPYVILGHSERRQYFAETDQTVSKRMHAALQAGLMPIVCIGETLKEREANTTFQVIERQLKGSLEGLTNSQSVVLAYEPVWAIGTGKTATPAQAQEVHAFIRAELKKNFGDAFGSATRILYGGSVKPDNMNALMQQPDIDGGLVGGASLDAASFLKIIHYNG